MARPYEVNACGPGLRFTYRSPPGAILSAFAPRMKILLILVGSVVVLASIFADYKWRQWMAKRRRDRQ